MTSNFNVANKLLLNSKEPRWADVEGVVGVESFQHHTNDDDDDDNFAPHNCRIVMRVKPATEAKIAEQSRHRGWSWAASKNNIKKDWKIISKERRRRRNILTFKSSETRFLLARLALFALLRRQLAIERNMNSFMLINHRPENANGAVWKEICDLRISATSLERFFCLRSQPPTTTPKATIKENKKLKIWSTEFNALGSTFLHESKFAVRDFKTDFNIIVE